MRECFNEITQSGDELSKWAKEHKKLFHMPSEDETEFISKMFSNYPNFQKLVDRRKINLSDGSSKYSADPFLIALAFVKNSKDSSFCVVTEEVSKEQGGSKIPDVCKKYDIKCLDLNGFMTKEGWSF